MIDDAQSSRDEQGRFCGQSDATGKMVPTPDDLCGYCGPGCSHCAKFRVYCLDSQGVWTCEADNDIAMRDAF